MSYISRLSFVWIIFASFFILVSAPVIANNPSVVRTVQIAGKRLDVPSDSINLEYQTKMELAESMELSPIWEVTKDEGELGEWSYLLIGHCQQFADAFLLKHKFKRVRI